MPDQNQGTSIRTSTADDEKCKDRGGRCGTIRIKKATNSEPVKITPPNCCAIAGDTVTFSTNIQSTVTIAFDNGADPFQEAPPFELTKGRDLVLHVDAGAPKQDYPYTVSSSVSTSSADDLTQLATSVPRATMIID